LTGCYCNGHKDFGWQYVDGALSLAAAKNTATRYVARKIVAAPEPRRVKVRPYRRLPMWPPSAAQISLDLTELVAVAEEFARLGTDSRQFAWWAVRQRRVRTWWLED